MGKGTIAIVNITQMNDALPYWPAALRLDQAAAYCGLSVDTFKEVCSVKPIPFTQSSRGARYLRKRLDEWLDTLDPNTAGSAPTKRSWGERLGAKGQSTGT